MSGRVRVQLDQAATAEEVEAVVEAFREEGVDADTEASWQKPAGVGNGAFWMILIGGLGAMALEYVRSFGRTLGERHGHAAADALARFFRRLRSTRASSSAPSGWIQFEDDEGTTLMLTGKEPPEALDALLELDPVEHRGRMLMWDFEAEEWFDPNRPREG